MSELIYEGLSYKIRGAIFNVYKSLGCSYKESIYQKALIEELISNGLKSEREKRIDILYNGKKVGTYVPDIVVAGKVILELKAKPRLVAGDKEQFWYYLKGSDYKLGFLVNFGRPGGVEIIRRVYETARVK